jgi:hypothetical protein
VTISQATVVQPASILYRHTLNTEQGATILLYKVFYKGKDNFIFLGKFIFIIFQGLRKLILLKTKDRCTSLTVIRVTKIMCNRTGKFKGKLPLKCFNYGKVGHVSNKCPYPKQEERDGEKTYKE